MSVDYGEGPGASPFTAGTVLVLIFSALAWATGCWPFALVPVGPIALSVLLARAEKRSLYRSLPPRPAPEGKADAWQEGALDGVREAQATLDAAEKVLAQPPPEREGETEK